MSAEDPLERRSLVDLVTAKLRDEILSGRYDKGATLPAERALAEKLRVNRTSLKHALMRLEQLGFISTRHGIGSVVLDPLESAGAQLLSHWVFRSAGIDRAALSDVIEARTLMGGFLARLAAERRTKDDLKRMRHALAKLESAEADPERIQELELGFFRSMLQATNNRIFVLVANSMFAIYGSRAHVFREAFADGEHTRTRLEKIAQAIEEKNGETAEKVAVEYLRAKGRALVDAAVRAESLE